MSHLVHMPSDDITDSPELEQEISQDIHITIDDCIEQNVQSTPSIMSPLANFFLGMRETKGLTANNCNDIIEKFSEICLECSQSTENKLNECTSLSDEHKYDIMKPLYSLQNSFDAVNSQYKREAQCMSYGYIAPKKLSLPEGKYVAYVPILDQLSQLLKHDDILSEIYSINKPHSDLISKFSDGSSFKLNPLFQTPAIQIKIYVDDFQIINPLSNKVRYHKVCAVYWQLGNIPQKYNSNLHTIQLLALTKSANVKKYGFQKILNQAIHDLKKLECEGITILNNEIQHHFFGTISVLIADNLAAHEMGGFIESFNSLRICRFCMVTKTQMKTCFDERQLVLRTTETFKAQLEIVENDPSAYVTYGIKTNSVLNQLDHYHVCWGSPSDVAHDVLEGFGHDLLKATVENCIHKGFSTLKEINIQIESFPYIGKDKTNKPVAFVSDPTKKNYC